MCVCVCVCVFLTLGALFLFSVFLFLLLLAHVSIRFSSNTNIHFVFYIQFWLCIKLLVDMFAFNQKQHSIAHVLVMNSLFASVAWTTKIENCKIKTTKKTFPTFTSVQVKQHNSFLWFIFFFFTLLCGCAAIIFVSYYFILPCALTLFIWNNHSHIPATYY